MARRKKINPLATAFVIAGAVGVGFLVWKFVISPKKKSMREILPPYGENTMDSDFVEVIDQNVA
jgi:hypothetical protein